MTTKERVEYLIRANGFLGDEDNARLLLALDTLEAVESLSEHGGAAVFWPRAKGSPNNIWVNDTMPIGDKLGYKAGGETLPEAVRSLREKLDGKP